MPKEELVQVQGVVIELSEDPAIKFVAHGGYDKLLCEHVYMRFCPNCPQIECVRRRV